MCKVVWRRHLGKRFGENGEARAHAKIFTMWGTDLFNTILWTLKVPEICLLPRSPADHILKRVHRCFSRLLGICATGKNRQVLQTRQRSHETFCTPTSVQAKRCTSSKQQEAATAKRKMSGVSSREKLRVARSNVRMQDTLRCTAIANMFQELSLHKPLRSL